MLVPLDGLILGVEYPLRSIKKMKVCFLIPSTSNKCDYKNIEASTLYFEYYKSIINFDIKKYDFLIGFDSDDVFYKDNIEELKKLLPNNFHYFFIDNPEKSYVEIVNKLSVIAKNSYDADYLFVNGDDLNLSRLDFIDSFIEYISKNNQIGLGHAQDCTSLYGICTNPFVSVEHINRLGYFYPNEIKNWYCDDWIHLLYKKLDKVIKTEDCIIKNKVIARYDIFSVKNKLESLVDKAFSEF